MQTVCKISLAYILTLFITLTVKANNITKVSSLNSDQNSVKKINVNISVFSLDESITPDDYLKVLKQNKPQYQPHLLALSGEPAVLNITNKKSNNISVNFLANKQATQYDLTIELVNDNKKNIASVNKIEVGHPIVFSANLSNKLKLIKVDTAIDNSTNLNIQGISAISQLKRFNKLNFIMPSQQYFDANNIYRKDNKLKKSAKRALGFDSLAEQASKFSYITNMNDQQIIKGIIKVNDNNAPLQSGGDITNVRGGKLASPTSIGKVSTKRHKDYLFEFYVLPNKTIFLGQFSNNANVNIIYASYLSTNELNKLKRPIAH